MRDGGNIEARILIVDDDDVDRRAVRSALVRSQMQVDLAEASCGSEALALWELQPFDCVLLDYRMPDMNGDELFRELLSIRPESPISAVFLTGRGDEALALEMIGSGALDFMPKSDVSPASISRVIRYALARQSYIVQLNRLANEDPLTQLANRSLFSTMLDRSIAKAKRAGTQVGILLLDLDRFKRLNDTLGHSAGDAVLIETARRLRRLLRQSDTVARLGGDEFAIYYEDEDTAQGAGALAERITTELAKPFLVEDQPWHLGASVGISVFPFDGADADEMIRNADLALYKAKATGPGSYRFFTEELNKTAQERRRIEVALRESIPASDAFELHFQPRMDPSTGRMLGSEALIRWRHPDGSLTMPDAFIPIAESTGLIGPIGRLAIDMACRECATWSDFCDGRPFVSVNVSPLQLVDDKILETVCEALERYGLHPDQLEIEITETAAMDNREPVMKVLDRLGALGIGISIDDFGSGYSSLSRLQDLPVNKLKIDRSFIAGMTTDTRRAPIVDLIISLGKHLDLGIVAEGAEDAETVAYLAGAGCDEIQGFHFAGPMPADEFRRWCGNREQSSASAPKPRLWPAASGVPAISAQHQLGAD